MKGACHMRKVMLSLVAAITLAVAALFPAAPALASATRQSGDVRLYVNGSKLHVNYAAITNLSAGTAYPVLFIADIATFEGPLPSKYTVTVTVDQSYPAGTQVCARLFIYVGTRIFWLPGFPCITLST